MVSREAPPRFLEAGAPAAFDEARVAVLPVPYEGTTSYMGGTARGPAAILDASSQLELFDERTRREPYRQGVWTDAALDVAGVGPEEAAARVERRVGELLDAAKWPVMLGGEHSITSGAVRAASRRSEGLCVVQFDAHADLRDSYQGSRHSHASVMARCLEVVPVRSFGVRSYSAAEAERIRSGADDYRILHAWEMPGSPPAGAFEELSGRPVYLTVDVDVFDPSVIPATGTPEPGGLGWWQALRWLEALFAVCPVVACDIVELAPAPGLHHAEYAAARLAYSLMGWHAGTRP